MEIIEKEPYLGVEYERQRAYVFATKPLQENRLKRFNMDALLAMIVRRQTIC
jgi:hypothetical protein